LSSIKEQLEREIRDWRYNDFWSRLFFGLIKF
jgi:hypothetical protein